MSCSITYPTAGGDGAVDGGGNLVSCCGEWHRPAGSAPGEICRIYGMCYPPTGPVDPDPDPLTFPEGTLLLDPTGDSGTFHFNSAPIPGAGQGSAYRVKVWLTADDITFYEPFGPRGFNGCVYGDADCEGPPCLEEVVGGLECVDDNVIQQIAPVDFWVQPDQRTVELFEAARVLRLGKLVFDPIVLSFSLAESSPGLAVWSAESKAAVLRLEVKRGHCCLTATLYLMRISEAGIEPTARWKGDGFSLTCGGILDAISAKGKKIGGGVLVSPPRPRQAGKGDKTDK